MSKVGGVCSLPRRANKLTSAPLSTTVFPMTMSPAPSPTYTATDDPLLVSILNHACPSSNPDDNLDGWRDIRIEVHCTAFTVSARPDYLSTPDPDTGFYSTWHYRRLCIEGC